MTSSERREPDRCPGLLRPFVAADGALIRLRVPGGQTTALSLAALSRLAASYGDGHVAITSRANVQIRGLTVRDGEVDDGLVRGVIDAGYLPHPAYERIRNIIASPLTGLAGGYADLRPLVAAVDRLLVADPALADLPGRFLVALDDGHRDMDAFRSDLSYSLVDRSHGVLRAGGQARGELVPLADAARLVVERVRAFMRIRRSEWRMDELPDGGAGVVRPRVDLPVAQRSSGSLGILAQDDGAATLHVHVPLGLITAAHIAAISSIPGDGTVVITPWRGLVVPAVDARDARDALESLRKAGLVTDAASAWSRVFACVGAPGCARAQFNTRRVAEQMIAAGAVGVDEIVYVGGCDRRCGQPAVPHRAVTSPVGH